MIPALPENDNQGGPPAHPREPATEQRFSDGYERDVLDFVNKQLDAGASEEGIVASLLAHDFGRYEARRLIRELARERDRARSGERNDGRVQHDDAEHERRVGIPIEVRREAALKDLALGAMWFFGGLILTMITFMLNAGASGVLFWGAMLWGGLLLLRGMSSYANLTKR